MHAQLGTIIFERQKTFGSFSVDEEAVVVEHALINKKPRLQGAALGLRNLQIGIFLHQEFCNVIDELEKLRAAKDAFEVLPLLWGNGRVEGEFVIISMSESKQQMDGRGNTISANISLTLKESVSDDKLTLQQQKAQKSAMALGDKQPPAKSSRVNPISDNKKIANIASETKASTGTVDICSRKYSNAPSLNTKIKKHLDNINKKVSDLLDECGKELSPLKSIPGYEDYAGNLKEIVNRMTGNIQHNIDSFANPVLIPNIPIIKSNNEELQTISRVFFNSMDKIIKAAILRK